MSFREFPTQAGVVQILQRSLDRGRLGHAYLFSGNNAEELESAAAALAKTLNCANPVRGQSGGAIDSCDRCDSCKRMDANNHPDVQWIRAESKLRIISIDQIRELLQTVYLKPTLGGHKIAILTAADRLNVQAANAFLKTLEEPPEKTVFILLTTDVSRIVETILSRCLRLSFSGDHALKLAPDEEEWLRAFATEVAGEKPGLFQRYRLLDALIKRLAALKEQIDDAFSAQSPLNRGDIKDIDPDLREKWESELAAAIEAEYRRRRSQALSILHWWLRDVWLMSAHSAEAYLTFPDLLGSTRQVAARVKEIDAMENLRLIDQTQQTLHTNAQEALALEVGFLRLKL